jgi:hypothetical protein
VEKVTAVISGQPSRRSRSRSRRLVRNRAIFEGPPWLGICCVAGGGLSVLDAGARRVLLLETEMFALMAPKSHYSRAASDVRTRVIVLSCRCSFVEAVRTKVGDSSAFGKQLKPPASRVAQRPSIAKTRPIQGCPTLLRLINPPAICVTGV